jgi:hypothetical protein
MIIDFGLPLLASGLLRVCSPLRAHAVLVRVGAFLPELHTPGEARGAMQALGGRGTCLTRALAVAARAPAADVVIGVAPGGQAPLLAHAWVEMDGAPIDPSDVAGTVIARLRGPLSTTRDAPAGE